MHGRGRHGRRRGRGRGGRGPWPITRFVQPCLLLLLHHGPAHGYSLMEGLVSFGFAEEPVDSGAVYRYLREMEQDGLVASEWDTEAAAGPARRVYRLTAEGERALSRWIADLQQTDQVLHRLFDAYEKRVQESQE